MCVECLRPFLVKIFIHDKDKDITFHMEKLQGLSWFQQEPKGRASKVHFVDYITKDGRQKPLCRKDPFARTAAEVGTGFPEDLLEEEGRCKNCLNHLPDDLKASAENIIGKW